MQAGKGQDLPKADATQWAPTTDMPEQDLVAAREAFKKNSRAGWFESHGIGSATSLTEAELSIVVSSIELATAKVSRKAAIEYYKYYSDHKLEKMDEDESAKAKKTQLLAATDPEGGTRLRQDILQFSPARLGPLLLHEQGHTHDKPNAMGSQDHLEGHAYAVEYFFSLRTGDTVRQAKIVEIIDKAYIAMPPFRPALQELFRVTLATLIELNEILHSIPPQRIPAAVRPSADVAHRLLAERIAHSEPQSPELIALTGEVRKRLSAYALPV